MYRLIVLSKLTFFRWCMSIILQFLDFFLFFASGFWSYSKPLQQHQVMPQALRKMQTKGTSPLTVDTVQLILLFWAIMFIMYIAWCITRMYVMVTLSGWVWAFSKVLIVGSTYVCQKRNIKRQDRAHRYRCSAPSYLLISWFVLSLPNIMLTSLWLLKTQQLTSLIDKVFNLK